MLTKNNQVYSVVDESHNGVIVHGELVPPFWDERKRELCISFCSGALGTLLGMLLLTFLTGGSSGNHDTNSNNGMTNPMRPPIQSPVYNTTTVEPLMPPIFSTNASMLESNNGEQKNNNEKADSSSWWSIATHTVHGWLGGKHSTKMSGGGRDWLVNAQNGMVSSKHDPTFWLGVGPSPLVLVPRDSSKKLLFSTQPSALSSTMENPTIDLVTQDSKESVGFSHLEAKQVEGYAFYDTVVSPFVDAVSVAFVQNKFLVLDDDWVLDVAYWKIVENQKVNFVKSLNDNTTFVSGGGRDWVLNDDGSISPYLNRNLVLGMGPRGLIITQRQEMALHLSHSQELADGQTVPMELNGEAQVVSATSQQSVDDWNYRQTILADDTAVRIKYDGNFILLAPDEAFALDIANWAMEEGNTVNFVGGDD